MADEKIEEISKPDSLGPYLKSARLKRNMTLRDVEQATGKEVSNAYLSQLESGKITKPSVHALYALSTSLGVPYETLMHRAGYIVPSRQDHPEKKQDSYSVDDLTADEEKELRNYLNYIRSKKKKA
jgi:HTH-type transcriptional regulator, competence development regulator